jgi:CheY-like chemotaxis protein
MKGPHLLVVEDDAGVREPMVEFLRSQGYRVSEAQNGIEALNALDRDQTVDLILLDLAMPIMSGVQFLEEKAKRPELAHISTLVLSGNEYSRKSLAALGVDIFLKKPIAPPDLVSIVDRRLH